MAAISSALISVHLGAEIVVQGGGPFLSFLEVRVANRGICTRDRAALLNPRFSAFQAYHVASRHRPLEALLMNALNPLSSAGRRRKASPFLRSEAISLVYVYFNYRILRMTFN